MALTLGYKASVEQFGPRELVELGVLAEAHGMDCAFVSDHIQPWRHDGGHAPSALAWLAAVGERTSSLTLGTSVLTPTFRHNVGVVAQTFATLGMLHPGRVVLGLGTGEALNEVAVTGLPWPPFRERLARLREAVEVLRLLWSGERVSYHGDHVRVVDATVYDRPEPPVPIWLAAGGPVMARYAGEAGDGFICTSGKGMDLYTGSLLPAVDAGRAAAGGAHRAAAYARMIEVKLSYDVDARRALEDTRFWAPLALGAQQKATLHDPVEMQRAADALPIEQVASRWIVASDPDEVAERVRPYVGAGFDTVVLHSPAADQRRFLTAFERDLAPRLRALG